MKVDESSPKYISHNRVTFKNISAICNQMDEMERWLYKELKELR
jgi:hypothetical protein